MTHSTCKGCGESILWARTEGGSLIPLDALANKPGANMALVDGIARTIVTGDLLEPVYSGDKYLAHFSSCPKAHEFGRSARK